MSGIPETIFRLSDSLKERTGLSKAVKLVVTAYHREQIQIKIRRGEKPMGGQPRRNQEHVSRGLRLKK